MGQAGVNDGIKERRQEQGDGWNGLERLERLVKNLGHVTFFSIDYSVTKFCMQVMYPIVSITREFC